MFKCGYELWILNMDMDINVDIASVASYRYLVIVGLNQIEI